MATPHLDDIGQREYDAHTVQHLMTRVWETRAQHVVEIGTRTGNSARIFCDALRGTQGRLTSIDIADCAQHVPREVTFIHSDSLAVDVSQWPPVDVLYLDSDHHEPHVMAELERFGPLVRRGGCILLHDVYHSEFGAGIRRALAAWAARRRYSYHVYAWGAYGLGEITVS